jgi:hypothetical protein
VQSIPVTRAIRAPAAIARVPVAPGKYRNDDEGDNQANDDVHRLKRDVQPSFS